jgi:subtilisin family serine protease
MLNISSLWSLPHKQNVKICIIDTGYDIGHPDLPTNHVTGWEKESTCGSVIKRVDWRTDESYNSHGTHVSGTISTVMNYRSEFDRHIICPDNIPLLIVL